MNTDLLIADIRARLTASGEYKYQRYPSPLTAPSFASAGAAAETLLHFLSNRRYLVLRDQCLHNLRHSILRAGYPLVLPDRAGHLYHIPSSSFDNSAGVDAMIKTGMPYAGSIDALVVACWGFKSTSRRLYSFDADRTNALLSSITDDLHQRPPLFASIASDSMEVNDWPDNELSLLEADVVFTSTRATILSTGERFNK